MSTVLFTSKPRSFCHLTQIVLFCGKSIKMSSPKEDGNATQTNEAPAVKPEHYCEDGFEADCYADDEDLPPIDPEKAKQMVDQFKNQVAGSKTLTEAHPGTVILGQDALQSSIRAKDS